MPPLATTLIVQPRSSAGCVAILQVEPMQSHDWGIGDATNVDNWTIGSVQDQDPDLYIADVIPSAASEPGVVLGKQFDVTFSRALVPGAEYTLTEQNLQDDGTDATAGTPIASAFGSFVALASAIPPPSPQAILWGTDIFSDVGTGDWAVGPGGDYANESGKSTYRKRGYRRLVTNPGDFKFPGFEDYGVGALGLIKKLARNDQKRRLITRVQTQFAREPGTAKVTTSLVPMQNGLTRIFLTIRTVDGDVALAYPPLQG